MSHCRSSRLGLTGNWQVFMVQVDKFLIFRLIVSEQKSLMARTCLSSRHPVSSYSVLSFKFSSFQVSKFQVFMLHVNRQHA